ncbi:uncharacterized protein FIBRA_02613 [Fibroporia radiculosa]|uniref:C3H1-type domain-containing protein n=1 Tax=Fibroporia radiculosa TaxID=599839 RepID=J4G207_9APHY|nr:uncharacterized protein FIBRA_02613 [Fibroporia radiculosa]CCM00578.1 predicted protein [Fibroporia radiculosa]
MQQGIPASSISDSSSASTESGDNSKRTILLLSLDKENRFEELHSQLYVDLRKNAIVKEAVNPKAAKKHLSTSPSPFAVIVTHSSIAKHDPLTKRTIGYAHSGGRAIFGFQFGNKLELGNILPFFQKWGYDWAAGDYHRITFTLNSAGIPSPLRSTEFFDAYSMKAVHLKNVMRKHAVYVPMRTSYLESLVFDPDLLLDSMLEEFPAVWAPMGSEMCGVSISPGDLGPRTGHSSLTVDHRGIMPAKEFQSERPLPFKKERARRPREDEVASRAVIRASSSRPRRMEAEKLKEKGRFDKAANMYLGAAMVYGPRPVYLTNLTAALLKIKPYPEAVSAASRALYYEPMNLKARYRRAMANELDFDLGDLNLRHVLRQDPSSEPTRIALGEALSILSRAGDDDDSEDAASNISTESGSSEFLHGGNGIPCRYLNHEGCRRGSHCRFKHAPDAKNIRDKLGRNVCFLWLIGHCRFRDCCYYAHDETYLPDDVFWNSDAPRKTDARVSMFKEDPGPRMQQDCFEAYAVIHNWRFDRWIQVDYYDQDSSNDESGPAVYTDTIQRNREFQTANKMVGPRFGHHMDKFKDDDEKMDNYNDFMESGIDEQAENFGFARDEARELLCQGIKPWDDDAWDVLHALQDM